MFIENKFNQRNMEPSINELILTSAVVGLRLACTTEVADNDAATETADLFAVDSSETLSTQSLTTPKSADTPSTLQEPVSASLTADDMFVVTDIVLSLAITN